MQYPRLPAGLIYTTVVLALVLAAVGRRQQASAPAAPPPQEHTNLLLSAVTGFDPARLIRTGGEAAGGRLGSAFSVSETGVWLTARHVVEGCGKLAVMVSQHQGVEAKIRWLGGDDIAVLATEGGAPPLALALDQASPPSGAHGFHPGFPGGLAGELATRYLGRQTTPVSAALARSHGGYREPVTVWAEAGRTEEMSDDLAGLSGAPVLNDRGEVVGLTIAFAPRRGHIYALPPETLAAALKAAKVPVPHNGVGEAITFDDYGEVADSLRRDFRVAEVRCLTN
jgi:serine protease Do